MSEALKKRLESRIKTAERVIATKRATIERARMDLADLADADARLSKQRQKVIRRAGAASKGRDERLAPAHEILPGESKEIPFPKTDFPPPATEEEKKQKSKLTFW